MDSPRVDAVQFGIHARDQVKRRGISLRAIERLIRRNAKRYAGTSPGTFRIEGETEPGRLIAVIYSELHNSRGRVAYVVTAFPIRRYSDDPTVV